MDNAREKREVAQIYIARMLTAIAEDRGCEPDDLNGALVASIEAIAYTLLQEGIEIQRNAEEITRRMPVARKRELAARTVTLRGWRPWKK